VEKRLQYLIHSGCAEPQVLQRTVHFMLELRSLEAAAEHADSYLKGSKKRRRKNPEGTFIQVPHPCMQMHSFHLVEISTSSTVLWVKHFQSADAVALHLCEKAQHRHQSESARSREVSREPCLLSSTASPPLLEPPAAAAGGLYISATCAAVVPEGI
jgi:hypothetical protein